MFVLLYLFEEIFHYTYFIIHTMHMYISSINARLVFIKKKIKKNKKSTDVYPKPDSNYVRRLIRCVILIGRSGPREYL